MLQQKGPFSVKCCNSFLRYILWRFGKLSLNVHRYFKCTRV